jgi:hypothetical protein
MIDWLKENAGGSKNNFETHFTAVCINDGSN